MRYSSRQNQRDGLGEVANNAVAFFEQPQRYACLLGCPFAQFGRGYGALGAAPREKRDGPKTVWVVGLLEIIRQRGNFGVGLGALIDGGE